MSAFVTVGSWTPTGILLMILFTYSFAKTVNKLACSSALSGVSLAFAEILSQTKPTKIMMITLLERKFFVSKVMITWEKFSPDPSKEKMEMNSTTCTFI